jgi:hypothetical protein
MRLLTVFSVCARQVVSLAAHMYIMRSKKDMGIRSVVAAKISSAKGYSSSSSFPCSGVELDVGSESDVGTFFNIPLCSIRRHCSSSESWMRGVFWL